MRIVATLRVLSSDSEISVFMGDCENVLDFLQESYYSWMFKNEADLEDDRTWNMRDQVLLELAYITGPDQMIDYAESEGVELYYREITQEEIQSLM